MKIITSIFAVVIILIFSACDKFEYSPYQTGIKEKPGALNDFNISKLLALEPSGDDTVTILYSGDSHRNTYGFIVS